MHELGHLFDVGLYNIRNSIGWKAAKEKDKGAHATRYAATNDKEDYAANYQEGGEYTEFVLPAGVVFGLESIPCLYACLAS